MCQKHEKGELIRTPKTLYQWQSAPKSGLADGKPSAKSLPYRNLLKVKYFEKVTFVHEIFLYKGKILCIKVNILRIKVNKNTGYHCVILVVCRYQSNPVSFGGFRSMRDLAR